MKKYNIAVVGATGLVGRTFLKVLEERNFPVNKLYLFASPKSKGMKLSFRGEEFAVEELSAQVFRDVDFALFSAGKDVSLQWAPICAEAGCIVIDNSSAWRRDEKVPLIVPEVNPFAVSYHKNIIANPNCSTIQLVVALNPLYKEYGISRVVVSTYQAVSGGGRRGLNQLLAEINGQIPEKRVTRHKLAFNAVFHPIEKRGGYSVEEEKMMFETRRILGAPELKIVANCVRLPFSVGHCISAFVELKSNFELEEIYRLYEGAEGVVVVDEPEEEGYPTPEMVADQDLVYIGRIRRDDSVQNGLVLWIGADNLRKGAATNAIQIAELIIRGRS